MLPHTAVVTEFQKLLGMAQMIILMALSAMPQKGAHVQNIPDHKE